MRPVISVVGRANSGKTTLLEGLIAELKRRGHRLAVVKHAAEGFEIDRQGTDSWRFAEAGCELVAVSSPGKVAVIKKVEQELGPRQISRLIRADYDLLLTEGFKQGNAPKIEVHRGEQGDELLCPPKQLLAIVTDVPLPVDVPQFPADNPQGLADIIEENIQAQIESDDIELYVNNEHIPVNPFVKDLLARVMVAIVTGLKGVGQVKDLNIWLRRRG